MNSVDFKSKFDFISSSIFLILQIYVIFLNLRLQT